MLGAIIGDIFGSSFEFHPWLGSPEDIPLSTPYTHFTDDTVLTVAVAKAIRKGLGSKEETLRQLKLALQEFGRLYPRAGYGKAFRAWLKEDDPKPYHSFGNGSAMRVSAVGWAFNDLTLVEEMAELTALPTHNHPEGIKGARATAAAIFLARQGKSKDYLKHYIEEVYGYDLQRKLADIQADYSFDVTCQGSVPEAILAFLESRDYAETVRLAVWLGGDSDTQAAIAGSIAEAFYGGVPTLYLQELLPYLDVKILTEIVTFQDWLRHKKS